MEVVVDSGCHDRGGGGGDEDDFEIREEKGRPKYLLEIAIPKQPSLIPLHLSRQPATSFRSRTTTSFFFCLLLHVLSTQLTL